MANENRLLEAFVWNAQLGRQMIVDRIVEAQLAALDELHDRDPDRRLRNRADAKQRVGVDLAVGLECGGAVAAGHDDAGAVDDRDADAGDLVGAHRFAHRAVDEGLDLRVIDGRGRLGARLSAGESRDHRERERQAQHGASAAQRRRFGANRAGRAPSLP